MLFWHWLLSLFVLFSICAAGPPDENVPKGKKKRLKKFVPLDYGPSNPWGTLPKLSTPSIPDISSAQAGGKETSSNKPILSAQAEAAKKEILSPETPKEKAQKGKNISPMQEGKKDVAPETSSSEPPNSAAATTTTTTTTRRKWSHVPVDVRAGSPLKIHDITLGAIYWLTPEQLVSHVFSFEQLRNLMLAWTGFQRQPVQPRSYHSTSGRRSRQGG